jgi:hypothetical protein
MNHTTIGLLAVLAAATLVVATIAAAPAFASVGDGNTILKSKNKQKVIASGNSEATGTQANVICIHAGPCIVG